MHVGQKSKTKKQARSLEMFLGSTVHLKRWDFIYTVSPRARQMSETSKLVINKICLYVSKFSELHQLLVIERGFNLWVWSVGHESYVVMGEEGSKSWLSLTHNLFTAAYGMQVLNASWDDKTFKGTLSPPKRPDSLEVSSWVMPGVQWDSRVSHWDFRVLWKQDIVHYDTKCLLCRKLCKYGK